MVKIMFIAVEEFQRVRTAVADKFEQLPLIADMCRANALASVKRAGSGHLGSSFSSLDIVTMLYFSEMNSAEMGIKNPDRDIYLSSKGHDAPGLYSVLYSLGILSKERFMSLRRLGGTFGHPDVTTPGIEANSGSLGMGISKAKGMAIAKSLQGRAGRIFVMTGDGELQEGQVYEAFQTAAHQKVTNLNVIIDHNKVQSDKLVSEICELGNLEAKLRAFGWHVGRCDGHDLRQLEAVFARFRKVTDRPKVLIADTIKGKGVSFMEHPTALQSGGGLYNWHSGSPDDQSFVNAYDEIVGRINDRLARLGLDPLTLETMLPEVRQSSSVRQEYIADAFGEALLDLAAERQDLVVLDADLAADCRIRAFELKYPDRFIENGIAEQDMVSTAGGLALQGLLPVVNTFANFLASRANEQIYSNASEQTKVIYACHYSGLIPAGPGHSHQSIRDISLFSAFPNCVIIEPCNAVETRMALRYCVNEAKDNCALRLVIGPSPRAILLPDDYQFTIGRGTVLMDGQDAVLFAYGPVMLHEALIAAEILEKQQIRLKVVNMPWLNRVDNGWLEEMVKPCERVYVLDDHSPIGGLGDRILDALVAHGLLAGKCFKKLGVERYPACGTPQQALRYHNLDGSTLARRLRSDSTEAIH